MTLQTSRLGRYYQNQLPQSIHFQNYRPASQKITQFARPAQTYTLIVQLTLSYIRKTIGFRLGQHADLRNSSSLKKNRFADKVSSSTPGGEERDEKSV